MKNAVIFNPDLSVDGQSVRSRMKKLITEKSSFNEDGAVYNLELLAQVQRIRQYVLAMLTITATSVAAGVILTIVLLNKHPVVNPTY